MQQPAAAAATAQVIQKFGAGERQKRETNHFVAENQYKLLEKRHTTATACQLLGVSAVRGSDQRDEAFRCGERERHEPQPQQQQQ